MGDKMRPVPLREMIERIAGEYTASGSVFGIPEKLFFKKQTNNKGKAKKLEFFRESIATPIGPAAGPHTQLAQNIITAYLTGGRFFELKTVQKLDQLELEKPCIDAEDEAYNTEWSTELTVKKAYHEYVKAWIIIHLLEDVFTLSSAGTADLETGGTGTPPFAFNMSVGYDLAGIQLPKIDTFINDLTDASESRYFNKCMEELQQWSGKSPFEDALKALPEKISRKICSSLTISTLHGCPPEEIQSIAEYIMREKQLDTLVKLNPTLLGYERARGLLDATGFTYITVKEETFSRDLLYGDALPMLASLRQTAEKNGVRFGVKLSNTLPSVNKKGVLPDEEMYMSGRSLYPLTINLAADLAEDFKGELPISYCGGVSSLNAEKIFAAGIYPITMATDLLKPGGYGRMRSAADLLEDLPSWDAGGIRVEAVTELAEKAAEESYARKQWRGNDKSLVYRPLPLFDCYTAPCMEACPIRQDVPEYIRLTGEGKYKEALELIYEKNPLPKITGTICDHQCMYHCARLDYEGAVSIRAVKRKAAEKGFAEFSAEAKRPSRGNGGKTAVIGAGPAGLSAAFFLARYGCKVTVFEREQSAGGVVRNVLPEFRLSGDAIEQDIDFIKSMGVEFQFGVTPEPGLSELRERGYDTVCLAPGAEKGNVLALPGDGDVVESLTFLRSFRSGRYHHTKENKPLGSRVIVVGGGNTAMDSARAALRVPGVESVTVCYRRTEAEMPADREEYENAAADGVVFSFLLTPEEYSSRGELSCRVMSLGDPDETGRGRPLPTEEFKVLKADTLISAIGEHVDTDFFSRFGIKTGKNGMPEVNPETLETSEPGVYLIGDARTGPSTVVECIAEGRRAADALAKSKKLSDGEDMDTRYRRRAEKYGTPREMLAEISSRRTLSGTLLRGGQGLSAEEEEAWERQEQHRCLECDLLCNKCVEVCPNRANIAVDAGPGFSNYFQIVHLDAYCNECGNCATFCPYEGKPYHHKITVFSLPEDFEGSENTGVYIKDGAGRYRFKGINGTITENADGGLAFGPGADKKDKKGIEPFFSFIKHLYRNYSYIFGRVEQ